MNRVRRSVVVLVVVLVCSAILVKVLDNPVHQVIVGGESLSVSREGLLARWTPVENTVQTEMAMYLEKNGEYLEVLCAPSGPFQFTAESLVLPEGSFERGDSRASIHAVLGQPLQVSNVPHMGAEASAEGYTRRNSLGWPIAHIGLTYHGDSLYSCTAWREDRRDEFQEVYGHEFGELPDSLYETEGD